MQKPHKHNMSLFARIDISPAVISDECYEFRQTHFGGPSQVLSDLTGVGSEKPMGYVPVITLLNYYHVDVDRLARLLNSAGIKTSIERGIMHAEEPCFYAYDEKALSEVLEANKKVIEDFGWSANPALFVKHVEREAVPIAEELYKVIAEAFGDKIALQMWSENHQSA